MERTCDGSDSLLLDKDGRPCACGKTFDDVRYSTVWPHKHIPTRRERAFNLIENWHLVRPGLVESYPDNDWDGWLVDVAREAGLLDALPQRILGTAVEHSIKDPFTGEITVTVLLDGGSGANQ